MLRALPLFLLAACTGDPKDSGDTSSPDDTADDTAEDSETGEVDICGDTAAYDTWALPMTKASDGGTLSFTIGDATPSPPDKGDNIWTIALSTAGGDPVGDATVSLAPFMPEHGHGTNPATIPTTGDGAGSYTSDTFDLFMGGFWQLTVSASGPSGNDSMVINLCIEA